MVSDIAAQQWGIITSAQARSKGVAAYQMGRLVDRRVLQRIRHGVYVSAAVPWDVGMEARAYWLALEPEKFAVERGTDEEKLVVVSHEAAAEIYGIGDLPSNKITFTTPHRRQSKQPEVRFRLSSLSPAEFGYIEGLPVTTVSRTVLDLAADGHEPAHLRDLIADSIKQNLIGKDELAVSLAGIAEFLGASENTERALRDFLDGLLPDSSTEEDHVRKAIEDAIAPFQHQILELKQLLDSAQLDARSLGDESLINVAISKYEGEEDRASLPTSTNSIFGREARKVDGNT